MLQEDELLAVGLSDNSVALWDLKACSLVSRVKSQGLIFVHGALFGFI